ncbi:phage head-binding domain-containing protein [Salmonella enterica]|nr:phage tail protein [Salmonella enterica]EIL8295650.1 phage head-binding domain-containing protein [Salmonella enterica]EIS5894340.1 phage head-binding domain-containing protein [Salmonella enterica]
MSDITANVVVSMPSQLFTLARSFKAAANGKIYIGQIDTDPVDPVNQIPVYLENEDGSHVQVAQPIIINAGGFPVYNGQIAKFVTVQGHSMAVYDAFNAQQFYFPNILKYDPDQFSLRMENVADIHELMSEPTGNHTLNVIGYVPGTNFGGGQFYWDPLTPKSQHNGITIFSPTVPWDGSYAGLAAFLAGTGETDGSGSGCWIRVNSPLDAIHTEWSGHDVTGVNDSTAPVNACINKFGGVRSIRLSPGTLKVSFPTTYQYHDLFSVARKTAFVINGKNNLTIFAENDVNINTDGGGESERVCFGLIGCINYSFYGFKFNQTCTNFSTGSADTTFKPQEDWFGFVCEGSSGYIDDIDVLACRVFCMADTAGTGSVHNKDITLNRIRTDLITNYTFITRFLEGVATLSNSFMKRTGRTWHTYGEDFACADGTWHGKSINNHFVDPISLQSRVGPWGVRKSMTITGDTKSGGGIFVEIGGTSGSVASQNVTITNCVSDGAINADGTQSTHILIIGDEGDYATSFNSIRIINNTLRGGGRAIQDYNVGLLGKKATGLVIEDNNLDRPDRVTITSSAWVGTVYRNNKTHIQFGNQGCIIAGQYPTISGNDFDSTSLLAVNLGYRIDGANVENNNFSNNLSNPISRVMDWDNFAAMTYRNNRYIGLTGVGVFRGVADIIQCGWKHADATAGLTSKPTDIYPGKVSQSIGDVVYNSSPIPANFDFCYVAASSTTWGKVALVNP